MRKRNTYPAFLADETAQNVFIGVTGENSLVVDCTSMIRNAGSADNC